MAMVFVTNSTSVMEPRNCHNFAYLAIWKAFGIYGSQQLWNGILISVKN